MRRGISRLLGHALIVAATVAAALPLAWTGPAAAACFYHPPSPPPDAEARVRAFDFAGALGTAPPGPEVAELITQAAGGNAGAQTDLARRFLIGHGVPKSYDVALMLLYAAIGKLSGEAQAHASCTAGGIEEYIVARGRIQNTATPTRRPR